MSHTVHGSTKCAKCRGTGKITFASCYGDACFACHGSGYQAVSVTHEGKQPDFTVYGFTVHCVSKNVREVSGVRYKWTRLPSMQWAWKDANGVSATGMLPEALRCNR